MSVMVTKGYSVTAKPTIDCRKICQLLWKFVMKLCCKQGCCSVSQALMNLLASAPAVIGAIQIIIGLVNIVLGSGRTSTQPGDLTDLGAPYWLGGVYIVAGIMCIVAGAFPSPCLVGVAVAINLIGGIFAIVGIVLYATDMTGPSTSEFCVSVEIQDNCKMVALIADRLLMTLDILLIVLAVIQLCVNISISALGINALIGQETDWEEVSQDVEYYEPLSKELTGAISAV